jgi:murein DD-endopeptidase MepM/ murein hydrolase activator NlpD
MSNIAITQHVKRRVKAAAPSPSRSFHQVVDRNYSNRVFKESLKRRRLKKNKAAGRTTGPAYGPVHPGSVHPGPDHPVPDQFVPRRHRGPARASPLPGRSAYQFFFGPDGLFPLPPRRPDAAAEIAAGAAAGTGTMTGTGIAPGKGRTSPRPGRPRSGFPLSPLITAALTIAVSVAVINWKLPVIASVMGEGYLGAAGRAEEPGRNLASYAGLDQYAETAEETEAIPLDLVETFSWKEYKVAKGDTLSEIARAQQLDMGTLIASNGIVNARRLREGEILRIPNMDGIPYTVKAGDSLSAISAASSVPLQVILDVNDLESDVINPGMNLFLPGARMPQEDIRLALGESFIYPVRGVLSSPYGWRIDPIAKVERFHSAIDLAAPLGTPVKAAMDGRVSRVAVNSVYGNYIILTHQGSYQTLYAHLSAVSVKQGAWVTQNSKIGEVGSTGYSTGPHLHFSVFRNNKVINPLEVLQR